jgi:GT2 family glycosyltransferase/tetratricopeptide (TPR) repeat protein
VSYRYLFGPVSRNFAEQNLYPERDAGRCMAFDLADGPDLSIGLDDSWEKVLTSLPTGWTPDFIALWLPYRSIPRSLWEAPVPLIGLAADWNLLWHHYRRCLRRCELAFTDAAGVEAMHREGISHARQANLFGCERDFLEKPVPAAVRDIDVVFVGNLDAAVQRERLPWLGRVARLADRWKVLITGGVFGKDYRELLGRARIVFNRSARGECNRRAFEAAAAGALLFQETANQEVSTYFQDRQECVFYTEDNLEELLEYYLAHENERRAIAAAGQAKVHSFSFDALWQEALGQIEQDWPEIERRQHSRFKPSEPEALLDSVWESLSSTDRPRPRLASDLARALVRDNRSGVIHSALGVLAAGIDPVQSASPQQRGERAAGYFRRALIAEPTDLVAGLNLAEALSSGGLFKEAIGQVQQTLALLNPRPATDQPNLDAPHFPTGFDLFRVEWEKAAWQNAGDPAAERAAKRRLVQWRLQSLLGELTGDAVPWYEAVLSRPDLPVTHAALGCALGRAARYAEALPHLQRAVEDNPFDRAAARAYFETLGGTGRGFEQRRFARDQRLLARAAPGVVPQEAWFTDCPPAGDELATLIILCCNQLEYTRQCMESVLRHTHTPFELVLVDNGSDDGTGAYLDEIKARLGAARVVVIRNETNQGFAVGCNQALAKARGQYLVLLNNDTIVTDRWLEGLVALSLHDWPRTGLVGPVTSYARPPQEIPVDYQSPEQLDAFAAQRKRRFAGQALAVERLTGFCLLIRRDVLEAIGGRLDEQFGVGFFEDDDLCVRALEAGFHLAVALDVFIHHYGSRTFRGLGIDSRRQLTENLERFKAKWGEEKSAGYRLPEGELGPVAVANAAKQEANGQTDHEGSRPLSSRRPRVSLCMMVKDEEDNLPDCLRSVAGLVDEMVVVDTGSTDRTREIAREFGAQVHDFPWVDSFAAARNESLRHASGDWIFWMDADDRLDEENRDKFRTVVEGLNDDNPAYVMKCLCLPDPITKLATEVDHVRLFRNLPGLHWRYRVHEQILPALREVGSMPRFSDVVVHHIGYQDPALRGRKLQRDQRLLQLEHAEKPDDPFILFNLGSVLQETGNLAEALPLYRRSLELSQPTDSIVRKLYAVIAQCHNQLGQGQEAVQACQQGRSYYPDDVELLFQEGVVRRGLGDLEGAASCWEQVLEIRPMAYFSSVSTGLRGYLTRHNLAGVYHQLGRLAEAEAQWQEILKDKADYEPAWVGLSEIYLAQERWPELETIARELEGFSDGELSARLVRGRACLARREFSEARLFFEEAKRKFPERLEPRVLISHALLQEGVDPVVAERGLLEVLEMDPGNPEACQNLEVLRSRQAGGNGRPAVHSDSLEELYQAACRTPSDINEHCPRLHALAKECRHVTEMGTRTGVSTAALLFARPQKLVCYDRVRFPQVDRLAALAGETEFVFHQTDVTQTEIEQTDLLFIDTWHVYEQLREELRLHAGKVRRYIVLHDTTTFGEQGEGEGRRGLWPAIEEFLSQGTFRLKERYENNHGLTVLEAT